MRLAQVVLLLGIVIAALSFVGVIVGVRGNTDLVVIVGVLLFPLGVAVAVVGYLAARADAREKATINAKAETQDSVLANMANLQRHAMFQRIPPASGFGPEDS